METLNTYLAGLFAGVPDTAATRKAKADLLDLMTDHYHEELALGKSEAEAVGAAITAVAQLMRCSPHWTSIRSKRKSLANVPLTTPLMRKAPNATGTLIFGTHYYSVLGWPFAS